MSEFTEKQALELLRVIKTQPKHWQEIENNILPSLPKKKLSETFQELNIFLMQYPVLLNYLNTFLSKETQLIISPFPERAF